MKIIASLILLICCLGCQDTTQTKSVDSTIALGQIEHQFTIKPEANPDFEHGLLLLHSFEYDDAREYFDLAIKADPTELMSYWGKTMTYYKALWGLQDLEEGRAVMEVAGESETSRLALADNEMEADFWSGAEILFGEGEFKERNKGYSAHLAQMYEKYPGNSEVAAFYALSLLWADSPDGDAKNELLSAKIADGILSENPNHPGAVHYKIHALDNPALATDAQVVADLYAKIAPDATHALHMPSHIYLALGRWANVVACNEASYGASIKRIERKDLGPADRGYHSYAWLHYGYLQQGRYQDAAKLLTDMYTFKEESPNAGARGYLIGMQNAQMVEAPEWTLAMNPELDIKAEDLSIATQASQAFLAGYIAYQKNDEKSIADQIKNLESKIKIAALLVSEDGTAMCSAGATRYAPNRNTILMAETQLYQLEALKAAVKKDDQKFEEAIELATAKELSTEYGSGPPTVAMPSFEQYGYWLLGKGRFSDALSQFEISLQRSPKRVNALRGSLTALKALGKAAEALEVHSELEAIWAQADKAALKTIASI